MANTISNNSLLTTANGSVLTSDDQKKLDNLKQDRDNWVKQEKIKCFQKLPAHIRQKVVDSICIKECLEEINDIDHSDFEGQSDIQALEQKSSQMHINLDFSSGTSSWNTFTVDGIYPSEHRSMQILDHFTKDELMEAHAAITLEENLGDEDGL